MGVPVLIQVNTSLVGGFSPPLWKMMEFVSWDDDIPNMMGKSENSMVPDTTNQWLLTIINHHYPIHFTNGPVTTNQISIFHQPAGEILEILEIRFGRISGIQ